MHTPTLIIKTLIDELESEIVSLHSHLCAEEYQFLVKLREFDLRQGWRSYHFNYCAEWLNMKCGISLSTGREKLRVAKALFFLPHISGAYQNGELSYSKGGLIRSRIGHSDRTAINQANWAMTPPPLQGHLLINELAGKPG